MTKNQNQNTPELSKDLQKEVTTILKDDSTSKSHKMKQLFDLGLSIKEISNMMDIRYNFVYNVISNYCNMNGIDLRTEARSGKKDEIIKMHQAGEPSKAIAATLKTNYNYVRSVIKTYEKSKPAPISLAKVEKAE